MVHINTYVHKATENALSELHTFLLVRILTSNVWECDSFSINFGEGDASSANILKSFAVRCPATVDKIIKSGGFYLNDSFVRVLPTGLNYFTHNGKTYSCD